MRGSWTLAFARVTIMRRPNDAFNPKRAADSTDQSRSCRINPAQRSSIGRILIHAPPPAA